MFRSELKMLICNSIKKHPSDFSDRCFIQIGASNYIRLSFMWIHANIYSNYISYLKLLIFC